MQSVTYLGLNMRNKQKNIRMKLRLCACVCWGQQMATAAATNCWHKKKRWVCWPLFHRSLSLFTSAWINWTWYFHRFLLGFFCRFFFSKWPFRRTTIIIVENCVCIASKQLANYKVKSHKIVPTEEMNEQINNQVSERARVCVCAAKTITKKGVRISRRNGI